MKKRNKKENLKDRIYLDASPFFIGKEGVGMPIVFYKCKFCMQQYKKREEAVRCEQNHLKPIKAKAHKYAVGPYPLSLEVTFPNESKKIYVHEDELWQNGYKR